MGHTVARHYPRGAAAALLAWAIVWGLPSSLAQADDWPGLLGPHQNNSSAEKGLFLDWPAEGPPRVWRKRLGPSYSPPVVAHGKLIAFHRLGDQEVVEGVNARSGASLWDFRYATAFGDRYGYNGGPRSAPAIDGDRVYTYGAEGTLTCLELQTGKKVWQRALNKDLSVPPGFFGVGVSPVVEKDLVLLNAGGPGGAGVVGVDKKTGQVAWKAGDHGASYSTPVVSLIRGRRMAVFFTQEGLLAVAPDTGEVLHEFAFRSPLHESVNAASPVVVGDVIFLSAAYTVGSVALQVGPDGLKPLWRDKQNMQNHWATSVYHDGRLYGVHGRHEAEAVVRCLDWRTGAVRWTSPRGLGRATLVMADGHLIALGERGDLALIEVNPDRYVEKKRVRLLDYPCWAPPVLANGFLYIRSETVLVCLDLRVPRPAGEANP
jgi:outer membrane protein assembly factor BamB